MNYAENYRYIFYSIIAIILFSNCDKIGNEIPKISAKRKINKTWIIEKLYLNDTLISLTADQLKYNKTYYNDSIYFDSDGIEGVYFYDSSANSLIEKVKIGGQEKLTYTVVTLSDSALVLKLTDDGKINPNTKFHFRAKP